MCTFCLENGSSNYQCTVNKGLILPQYMLPLCPCPHRMVKRASVQTHKSFCSIFSHVECICQGPGVKKKKRKKRKKKKGEKGEEKKKKEKTELGFVQDSWHLVISGRKVFDLGAWKEESGNVLDTVQCLQKPHENLLCSFSLFIDGQLPYFTKFFRAVFSREHLTIFVD